MTPGTKTRYEFIGGTSKKFWEIEKPFASQGQWAVRVHFGRIGTEGQNHINVFYSENGANAYYTKKVNEKLGKGYKNVSTIIPTGAQKKDANPILIGTAATKKEKPACEHLQLRKTGAFKWECNACKTHIEFDKPPQRAAHTDAEEVTQARRFIDLSALRG